MQRLAYAAAIGAVVAACSSAAPRPAPAPAPAPGTPPPPAAAAPPAPAPRPPVAADRLERGRPVSRALDPGEVHRYRIELAAGQVALGAVIQNGVDLALIVFGPDGRKLAELDSPNGDHGPEPFAIEATTAGAYDLEVRPFELPAGAAPASPAAPRPPEGRYEARFDEVTTADAYAERKLRERVASPRIVEAWRAYRSRDAAAIAAFWRGLAGKAPIVEPYPGDPRDVLITFVLRSTEPYVGLVGGPGLRERPMVRLEGSDLWYLTARMPADASFDYVFIATDGPAPYYTPYRAERGPDARWARRQIDPHNPSTPNPAFGMSRTVLPGAPAQPWLAARADVPRGTVATIQLDSAQLKEARRVGVYTPPGYDRTKRYPLLVVFDGEVYGLGTNVLIPVPTILDNLIAAKKIPPIVAALVANQGVRVRDLGGSEAFAAFVAKELVPRLRADYRAGFTPGDTIATGSSLGGLASAYVALRHSDVVGKVLSQSGAYQWVRGSAAADLSPSVEGGWLMREYAASPRLPIRLYLDVGRFEEDLLASNRHMRDVLAAKGYPVTYVEFSGGHDYGIWRGTIADGLIALLAAR